MASVTPRDGIFTLRMGPDNTHATRLPWDTPEEADEPGPRNRPTPKQQAKKRGRRKAAKVARRKNR